MSIASPDLYDLLREEYGNVNRFNYQSVIAEIELPFEDFNFEKPSWLGKEVTGDIKYYNSVLSKNPYCNW